MSPFEINPVLLSVRGEDSGFSTLRPSAHEYAILEELGFVRREAQAEANVAYEDWGRRPCAETHAVYLAAQDRADAAQDELADVARRVAAAPGTAARSAPQDAYPSGIRGRNSPQQPPEIS